MPPEIQKEIQNLLDQQRQEFELKLREHYHNGNEATQINYNEIHDLPVQYVYLDVLKPGTDTSISDDLYHLHVPKGLDGLQLVEVHALVYTAGTTGTTDIMIENTTQSYNMLSTVMTIDSGETGTDTAATPAVIDQAGGNDRVFLNDVIAVNIDAISTGTAAKGLAVVLGFK